MALSPYPTSPFAAGYSSQVRPSSSRPPDFGVRPPHCFEEERHIGIVALVPEASDPPGMHWSGTRATFSADDHPVQAVSHAATADESGQIKRANERLATQKADGCGHRPEVPNAVVDRLVFDGSSNPNVAGETIREQIGVAPDEVGCPRRAFGEHLVDMPVDGQHYLEATTRKGVGHMAVEQVRHRVDENPSGCPPRLPISVDAPATPGPRKDRFGSPPCSRPAGGHGNCPTAASGKAVPRNSDRTRRIPGCIRWSGSTWRRSTRSRFGQARPLPPW